MASYLDGMMATHEFAAFKEHLKHCIKCSEALNELTTLIYLTPADVEHMVIHAGQSLVPEMALTEISCI